MGTHCRECFDTTPGASTGVSFVNYEQAVLPLQEAAHEEWIETARELAQSIAAKNGSVTSDDIHEVLPIPGHIDPRIMGAVFKPRRLWHCAGYRASKRKINHGRPIAIWELA